MTDAARPDAIAAIARLPEQLAALVVALRPEELTTPFLQGEWTVAQNVHHLADSHANAYIRCKLILTEDYPTLKPYDQDAWAALPDGSDPTIDVSLAILQNLHVRWVRFWQTLPEQARSRAGLHPDDGPVTLDRLLHLYAAHGESHIDQIRRTLAARIP